MGLTDGQLVHVQVRSGVERLLHVTASLIVSRECPNKLPMYLTWCMHYFRDLFLHAHLPSAYGMAWSTQARANLESQARPAVLLKLLPQRANALPVDVACMSPMKSHVTVWKHLGRLCRHILTCASWVFVHLRVINKCDMVKQSKRTAW